VQKEGDEPPARALLGARGGDRAGQLLANAAEREAAQTERGDVLAVRGRHLGRPDDARERAKLARAAHAHAAPPTSAGAYPSAVCHLPSAVCRLPSAVCRPLWALARTRQRARHNWPYSYMRRLTRTRAADNAARRLPRAGVHESAPSHARRRRRRAADDGPRAGAAPPVHGRVYGERGRSAGRARGAPAQSASRYPTRCVTRGRRAHCAAPHPIPRCRLTPHPHAVYCAAPSSSRAMPRLQTAPDLRYRGHAPAESERAPARAHTGVVHCLETPLSAEPSPVSPHHRSPHSIQMGFRKDPGTGQVRISLRRNDSAGRSRTMTPNTKPESPKTQPESQVREQSPGARTHFRHPLSDAAGGQRAQRNGPKQTPRGKRQCVLGRERRVALALWKGECRRFFCFVVVGVRVVCFDPVTLRLREQRTQCRRFFALL